MMDGSSGGVLYKGRFRCCLLLVLYEKAGVGRVIVGVKAVHVLIFEGWDAVSMVPVIAAKTTPTTKRSADDDVIIGAGEEEDDDDDSSVNALTFLFRRLC